jgi:hypothetical protein
VISPNVVAIIFSIVIGTIAIGILCYPLLVKWQRDRLMAQQFPTANTDQTRHKRS